MSFMLCALFFHSDNANLLHLCISEQLLIILFLLLQALKLSDDLHLNEIDCVRLIVSANQEVDFCCPFLFLIIFN